MIISIAQIIISVAIVVLILLQERSAGTSGIFGGGDEFYHARRGLERVIFYATIVLIVVFAGLALISLLA